MSKMLTLFFPGEDFHESIKDPFVFKDETVGCRQSKKTKVVKLPPFVPPRCTFTASGNGLSRSDFSVKIVLKM